MPGVGTRVLHDSLVPQQVLMYTPAHDVLAIHQVVHQGGAVLVGHSQGGIAVRRAALRLVHAKHLLTAIYIQRPFIPASTTSAVWRLWMLQQQWPTTLVMAIPPPERATHALLLTIDVASTGMSGGKVLLI